MVVPPQETPQSVEVQIAVQGEKIHNIEQRLDTIIRFMIAIALACIGSGISFYFVILSRLGRT